MGLNTVDRHLESRPLDGHFVYSLVLNCTVTGISMIPPCSMSACTMKRHLQRWFWHSNSFSASSIFIYELR